MEPIIHQPSEIRGTDDEHLIVLRTSFDGKQEFTFLKYRLQKKLGRKMSNFETFITALKLALAEGEAS